jgi:FAD-dependent oxidoreductase family protein
MPDARHERHGHQEDLMNDGLSVAEPDRRVPVATRADLVVVGGGPAGIAAAVAGARNGLKVVLLERYPYLGGLASGGMVLVLDDMCNGPEVSVRGLCAEMIERLERRGLAVTPPEEDRRSDAALWRKWSRWGVFDFHSHQKPQPICYATAFDPDGYKLVANEMVSEAGIELRLHSWFSRAIVEDGRIRGVIAESKEGRQAILGEVVVDATGDLDVAASAGAPFTADSYIVTTVFRLGNVDTDMAERFEYEEPTAFAAVDRQAKRIIGGSWDKWWLKTPLPGIVWCNCPHMTGYDGLKVADLTRADMEGRQRIEKLLAFVRAKMPGFERCVVVDVAPQLGIRQTRLLEGEYVVTKEDVTERRHFPDSIARGRDYYTPYRALLPRGVKQLLVAGRHYSATPTAQRISREIPPCMAMGEAAGIAAALARAAGVTVDGVDVGRLQRALRAQGADPGDRPAANASFEAAAE